ncbi:hypothetical protein B0H14DRAFT_3426646 [Mycena olivaceomarginata]|nr:hypothetical protein B0H14DRAFT_3426646 [Mycena olivaceomarginata]
MSSLSTGGARNGHPPVVIGADVHNNAFMRCQPALTPVMDNTCFFAGLPRDPKGRSTRPIITEMIDYVAPNDR